MDIVACTDKWCVMPTGVMMTSVCINNPDVAISFHVIHDDSVTAKDRRALEESIVRYEGKTIAFYTVDVTKFPCFPRFLIGINITQASYYRLMLPEILPDIPKVLYLDTDIIVRHSLLPLWNTDIAHSAVGAVPDGLGGDAAFYEHLQYPPQYGYFNSGVMLVNLDYWRQHDVVPLFMDYMQKHTGHIIFGDQDVLNYMFKDCKTDLPLTYNFTTGFLWTEPQYDCRKYEQEVVETRKDPVVVHFAGDQPWIAYNRLPAHPFASSFFKYQDMTKWKGVRIDKRSFKLRVTNFIADLLRRLKLKPQLFAPFKFVDIAPID